MVQPDRQPSLGQGLGPINANTASEAERLVGISSHNLSTHEFDQTSEVKRLSVPTPGCAAFPEQLSISRSTSQAELDQKVSELKREQRSWAKLSIQTKIELISQCIAELRVVAPVWVETARAEKGLSSKGAEGAEEWLAGPTVLVRNLRLLQQSLSEIARYGVPQLPGQLKTSIDGQVIAPVFPTSIYDRLLMTGFRGEVWMQPGVTADELHNTMAVAYRDQDFKGLTALVLGAGNSPAVAGCDVLYKLFVENQVVILKMNPVNEYLGPFLELAFRPLIGRGALRIVYGGATEGAYLCQHPAVDEIHITGSDKTHDAIVYGSGPEGFERKRLNTPILNKRITSELGNVSPVIIVPGEWSRAELRYQAENVAAMLSNNAGFNCNSVRNVITHAGWNQRDAFLDALRIAFGTIPLRDSYYPGAEQRYAAFVKEHPEAEWLGGRPESGKLPWTLVTGLDSARSDDICYTREAFCSLAGETPLKAGSVVEYLEEAVAFANSMWGSLSSSIIVHPKTLRDLNNLIAFERALADLKTGTVGVNHWAAVSYAVASTTWGAFPGNPLNDIGSGRGVVHNTYMFDRPEKSVLYGPFQVRPKPLWFPSHSRAHLAAEKLFDLEAAPALTKLPGLVWQALRG